jgi:phospholipid N-methyltransferase
MDKKTNMYVQLMTEFVRIYGAINIVQIGANDGQINDPIYDFVMKNKDVTNIALIEPQASIIEYLEKNYEQHLL